MKSLSIKQKQARQLRRESTEAEHILWTELRNRRFQGIKFRRQHNVGSYIADFISLSNHIIIEVDGGQHDKKDARIYDALRTKYLEGEGYRVLRFWNSDVVNNLEGVLALILSFSQKGKEEEKYE